MGMLEIELLYDSTGVGCKQNMKAVEQAVAKHSSAYAVLVFCYCGAHRSTPHSS